MTDRDFRRELAQALGLTSWRDGAGEEPDHEELIEAVLELRDERGSANRLLDRACIASGACVARHAVELLEELASQHPDEVRRLRRAADARRATATEKRLSALYSGRSTGEEKL